MYTAVYLSHTPENATKTFPVLHIEPGSNLEFLHPSLNGGFNCNDQQFDFLAQLTQALMKRIGSVDLRNHNVKACPLSVGTSQSAKHSPGNEVISS